MYEMGNRDDVEPVVSTRVCIVNPTENADAYMTKLSFGVPAKTTEQSEKKYVANEDGNG